ncbi:ketopantoate reductase PanE/ApbA C terminal-domain-containing protein [Aspergillus karnatakaensis]|uniref:ketopantoate reductase family protein n=1 Tax=Aspergillus karnatakaensis TaxID=1810916 RepID=UPI003CCD7401
MPRALVYGSGSIGILYGFILSHAGMDVTCLCRSNYERAAADGFTVRSTVLGDHHFRPHVVKSIDDLVRIGSTEFEYVVICTRALPSNKASAAEIAPLLATGRSAVVIIQNGIGVEQVYANMHSGKCIISAVTYSPTEQMSPTEIRNTESIITHLGLFPADAGVGKGSAKLETLETLCARLNAGGAMAKSHTDIQAERWKKVISNAVWNPVCALSRCRDVEFVGASPLAGEFIRAAMTEVVAVATAVGYGGVVDEAAIDAQLTRTAARPWPGVQPSMMADLLAKKHLEMDAIVGEIVRLARNHGVGVPRLETLYLLLRGYEQKRCATP